MRRRAMRKVELCMAFYWRCPDCGYINHCLPDEVPEEMEEEAYRQANKLQEWEPTPDNISGEVVAAPEEVVCQDCGEPFEVDFDDDDELDDELLEEEWGDGWIDPEIDY